MFCYCRALIFFWILSLSARAQLPSIGQWRLHLPYRTARQVGHTPGTIWYATPFSIFSIDEQEKSIERWDKLRGLAETGISYMYADDAGDRVIVGYNNSNIDIIHRRRIEHIDALKNAASPPDRRIKHINVKGNTAYISTPFGIVTLNLANNEIADTYVIGDGGAYTPVNATATDDQYCYAATAEGLKRAPLQGANLSDFRSWQLFSANLFQGLDLFQGKLVSWKTDSVFIDGNFLYTDGQTIRRVRCYTDRIAIVEPGRILLINGGGTIQQTLEQPGYIQNANDLLLLDDEYWMADESNGAAAYSGTSWQSFNPNSPADIPEGDIQAHDGTLYAAAGMEKAPGIFVLKNNEWINIGVPPLDSFPSLVSLAIDPRDFTLWCGSLGGGMAHLLADGSLVPFKQNSPLQPAYFLPGSYQVAGLCFDARNNLWISNYGSPLPLVQRKPDNTWNSFAVPFPIAENALGQIVPDDFEQLWIASPKGNGLFCYHTTKNQWKWYRTGRGDGNLPDNQVLSLARDKSGLIWVGTAKGIGIVQCAQQVFSTGGCDAILPVVQQDNFAGYLFSDDSVQAIAVDGANRKWIGTKNGVWLIGPDGNNTIQRFTAANSPLPSNNVEKIAIDGGTGEVFFATDAGLASFRGTATEAAGNTPQAIVFPNPVPPGYRGSIGIKGLPENAVVKITELDGRLVYQTRALGGQAVWNGLNYQGRRPAPGIYLVFVLDEARTEKLVTKIAFVQ